MFRKFAKADVIEVKSALHRVRTASLAAFAENKDGFNDYRTDDGYVYVRVRAISSRVNKNHDGWPSEELSKAYRSFIGKPIFVDHHNSDPGRTRGRIVDAQLHVEELDKVSSFDPYYADAPDNHKPPTWIELLLEVDAKQFPKLAKAVISGDIDSVSMGANVERTQCSHCANWATTPEEYCSHVRSKGAIFTKTLPDGTKVSKKSYEDCYDIGFFEISFVFDPADETALKIDHKTAKVAEIVDEGRDDLAPAPQQQIDPSDPQYAHLMHAAQAAFDRAFMHVGGGNTGPAEGFIAAKRAVEQMGYPQLAFTIANTIKRQHLGLIEKSMQHGGEDGGADSMDWASDLFTDAPGGVVERGVHNNAIWSSLKEADRRNPEPQDDMTVAPDRVDTLRQDQLCPICGSDMEDGVCEVCNYEEPPEGFDNPDLEKAQEVDEQMRQQDAQQAAGGMGAATPNAVDPSMAQPLPPQPMGAPPQQMAASVHVTGDKTAASNGGRVNTQERPILPVTRTLSDKAINIRVKQDATAPKESNRKEQMSDEIKKVADGATAEGGADVQADRRVDVDGVGAVAGDPEAGTKHENVEKETGGFVAPHTDTWSGNEGDSLGQKEPVTHEDNPHITVTHIVEADFPDESASGFPDHEPSHVDLEGGLKEEVGERTQTDSGEQFRSLKHTDPVTQENANEVGGPMGEAIKAPLSSTQVFAHAVKAMKLAETEVAMGIIEEDEKFNRIAELESTPVSEIEVALSSYQRAKTAKTASAPAATPAVGRMPSFSKAASVPATVEIAPNWNPEDSLW